MAKFVKQEFYKVALSCSDDTKTNRQESLNEKLIRRQSLESFGCKNPKHHKHTRTL